MPGSIAGVGLGFGPSGGGGGGTDVPAVTDVRAGVTYDSASKVGTLAVPDPANVRLGTKYGAGTAEFTGSLVVPSGGGTTPPVLGGPDPFGASAPQSAALVQLLEAVADRLRLYLRTEARVVQWAADMAERPPVEGMDAAAVGLGGIDPRRDAGAGRLGWPADVEVLVGVWTRYLGDQTGDHTGWLRRHDVRVRRAVDALSGKMLYGAYRGPNRAPSALPLTVAAVQLGPDRIIVKRVDRHEAGVSVLRFRVPTVLPLDPERLT